MRPQTESALAADGDRSGSVAPISDAGVADVAGTKVGVPAVDLRIVLFTVADGRLLVALDGRGSRPGLPRSAPVPSASLDAEAGRIVRGTTGLREQYLEQLYTLSARDEGGWVVVVSYLGLIRPDAEHLSALTGGWHGVDALASVGETDRGVIDYAVLRLRAKLGYTTIAVHLLPPTFTLSELQGVYEAILGRRLDKRNFRRRVIAAAILEATGEQRRDGSHRPALLYRARETDDRETFLTPTWAGKA